MLIVEWIRFGIGTLLVIFGLFLFAIEVFGSYRFDFVLNRMHAAAIGDTLGIGICMLGLIIFSGFNFTSIKILLVIIFLWIGIWIIWMPLLIWDSRWRTICGSMRRFCSLTAA